MKNILKSSKFYFFCIFKWKSFPLILIGLFLLVSPHAHSATWYVSPAGSDSNDGTSWAQAFQTIEAAISNSETVTGDQIWVLEGLYNISAKIGVNKAVAIYGSFGGTETQPSDRDLSSIDSIVDGECLLNQWGG